MFEALKAYCFPEGKKKPRMWKNWTGCFWLQFIKAWTWTVAIVGQKTIDSTEKLQKIHTKKKKILSKPF